MGIGRRGFRNSTIAPGPAPYFRPYSRNDDGGDQIHPLLARNAGRPAFRRAPAEKLPITISWSTPVAVPSRQLAAFASALDTRLCALNADYKQYRADDYGLQGPMVEAVAPGGFAAWMKSRGKLGGRHKVSRIINNAELFASLGEFARLAS
jgi:GH3 auxin-responsive promoter